MQAHEDHIPHVAGAQGVPGVKDIVVAEGDVDPGRQQFLDPGDAPALGISIHASLKMGVYQGVGDEVDLAHLQQAHQLGDVGVVIGVHRRGMAGGHTVLQAGFVGPGRQHLQTAALLVVDLVAVDVHQLIVLFRQFYGKVEGIHRILPGEFEMGDGPHRVGPHLHRVLHELAAVGEGVDALLGESHHLDVDGVPQFFPKLQQRFHGGELGVGHVHVGTHELHAVLGLHPYRPVNPLPHIRAGELLLAQAPALDALKQGAGLVPHWVPRSQAGVQVDVGFDKGGQGQTAGAVDDLLARQRRQPRLQALKLPVGDADIGGLRGVFYEHILDQHNCIPPFCPNYPCCLA